MDTKDGKSDRGVLYIVWGDRAEAALERSLKSLRQHHPELPVKIERIAVTDPIEGLLQKARMMALSPFNETLFLDADTIVLGRLDFGFAKAAQYGLACCICECPWARRYQKSIKGDVVEYNTGVLFFTERAAPVFECWQKLAPAVDSSIVFIGDGQVLRMPHADQCTFALSIEQTGFNPFILPPNWNFRPQFQYSFFGPLKIWHSYDTIPDNFLELMKYYEREDSIVQLHTRC